MKKWNKINQGNLPSIPRTMAVACTTLDKLIICGGKDENNVWNTDVLIYEAGKNFLEIIT